MGIINVTPDSFSGDGLAKDTLTEAQIVQQAVELARKFVAEGATFIDVGGESTRPQASATVSAAEELARALEAGADIINDIWALRHDPEMAAVAATHHVPVILMANMRGFHKREIVSDVLRFLSGSIDRALSAGIAWEHLIVDPGIGFGTTPEENLTLLRRLGELRVLGRPILLGTSRKSHIGRVLGGLPPEERLEGTAATVALGIAQGVDIVRVHDVHEMMRVVRMSDAIVRGSFVLS